MEPCLHEILDVYWLLNGGMTLTAEADNSWTQIPQQVLAFVPINTLLYRYDRYNQMPRTPSMT